MAIGFFQQALLWIVLLPLLGALINGVAGARASKSLVSAVAVGSVFGAFLLSLACFGFLLNSHADLVLQNDVYEWFSIDWSSNGVERSVPIRVRFLMDHLSAIMTVMVTGIGALIHVYSVGYMGDDPGYARFMTYLNLFMGSMLILVLASSIPLMFVGWEGVGLCSYLLIGFWYTNKDYAAAGRKAFVVNRIGDFGVLVGMFLILAALAGSTSDAFEFATINQNAARLSATPFVLGTWSTEASVATVGVLFFFLGCAGKSAQIPLYIWLPDAMAGPTPVSALIHAATMVTAGVYFLVRLSPLVVESPFAMTVIAIVGALTALVAASIALVQNQLKKVLAYSTVSQLGFMFAAVGMGAFAGGIFHVFTHAFFKACLFLGAGSVMHAIHAHGDADIRYLGGLKKWLPKTHITFAISTAAIAGLPLLSGFFSKDEILLGAATWGAESPYAAWVGWAVFGTLVLAATMTAFYMFRIYLRTFHGEYKGGHPPQDAHGSSEAVDDDHAHDHAHAEPHESPATMTVPLYVLAAGAAVVGFLGLPHVIHAPNLWSEWLTPQYEAFVDAIEASELEDHAAQIAEATNIARREVPRVTVATLEFDSTDPSQNVEQLVHAPAWVALLAMVLGTLAGLFGFGLAFVWYMRLNGAPAARLQAAMPGVHRFLMNKWYVDELYGATIVQLNKWLAVFAANLDRFVVDGLIAKCTALAMKTGGYLVTRTQTGAVYAYAAMFVLGLAGLGWWFMYPHPSLRRVDDAADSVTWSAGSGLGYRYRWDFDSNGEWDTDWGHESVKQNDYHGAQFSALVAVLDLPAFRQPQPHEVLLEQETQWEIAAEPDEAATTLPLEGFIAEDAVPPTAAYRNVLRVDGRLPGDRPASEAAEGEPPTTAIELTIVDGQERRRVVWGPERHDVRVEEGGGFSAMLGASDWLSPSVIPEADGEPSPSERRFVIVTVGGEPAGEPIDITGQLPEPRLLVRINGADIPDNDGVADGMLALAPGAQVSVRSASLTVAVRVRATVEVENAFGNLGRSSEDATLRLSGDAATAQLIPIDLGRIDRNDRVENAP